MVFKIMFLPLLWSVCEYSSHKYIFDFGCFPDEQRNESNPSFWIVGNGALYVVTITVHQPQDCVAGHCINYFPEYVGELVREVSSV